METDNLSKTDDYTLIGQLEEVLKGCEPITREYLRVALADAATFDSKQKDYGPANIAAFGEFGVLVRCNDKIARLINLLNREAPRNESVEDSWLDLSVYGVIARLCRAGLWEGV